MDYHKNLFDLSRLGEILIEWTKIPDSLPDIVEVRKCAENDTNKIDVEVYYTFDKLTYRSHVITDTFKTQYGRSVRLNIRFLVDGFLYPKEKDSGLNVLKTGISRHRNIPNWSTVSKTSAKSHFAEFANLSARFFGSSLDKIIMKVWYNFESSRIDIECTVEKIKNIILNFYFEPGFPVRIFDEDIWDE